MAENAENDAACIVYVTQMIAPTEFVTGPFPTSDAAHDWIKRSRTPDWQRVAIHRVIPPALAAQPSPASPDTEGGADRG